MALDVSRLHEALESLRSGLFNAAEHDPTRQMLRAEIVEEVLGAEMFAEVKRRGRRAAVDAGLRALDQFCSEVLGVVTLGEGQGDQLEVVGDVTDLLGKLPNLSRLCAVSDDHDSVVRVSDSGSGGVDSTSLARHEDSSAVGQVTGATVSGVGSGAAGAAPDVGPTVVDGSDIQVPGYSSRGLVDAESADSPLAAGSTPVPVPGANPNAKWLPLALYRQLGRAARAQTPSESAVTVTWASGRSETFRTLLTESEWVEALASAERDAGLARKPRALRGVLLFDSVKGLPQAVECRGGVEFEFNSADNESDHDSSLSVGRVTGGAVPGVGSGAGVTAPVVPTVEGGSDNPGPVLSGGLVESEFAGSSPVSGRAPAPAPGAGSVSLSEAWRQGLLLGWHESGSRIFGEAYRSDRSYLPFSIARQNPFVGDES